MNIELTPAAMLLIVAVAGLIFWLAVVAGVMATV